MTVCKRADLIVFSGIDGAGKSTQLEALAAYWASCGRRPKTIWARGGYTPGINIIKSCVRRLMGGRKLPPPGPGPQRNRAFSRPILRRLWLTLAIADLFLLYGIGIRWWQLWGRPVICDRYWQDTQLDFHLNFPDDRVDRWWLWRTLVRVVPRPDHAFLILISVEESQRRSVLKNEPYPDAADVLQQRWQAYESWARSDSWRRLDGNRPMPELQNEIRQTVGLPCA